MLWQTGTTHHGREVMVRALESDRGLSLSMSPIRVVSARILPTFLQDLPPLLEFQFTSVRATEIPCPILYKTSD